MPLKYSVPTVLSAWRCCACWGSSVAPRGDGLRRGAAAARPSGLTSMWRRPPLESRRDSSQDPCVGKRRDERAG
eukprot:3066085-Pyramimonas_sp.AAC.1